MKARLVAVAVGLVLLVALVVTLRTPTAEEGATSTVTSTQGAKQEREQPPRNDARGEGSVKKVNLRRRTTAQERARYLREIRRAVAQRNDRAAVESSNAAQSPTAPKGQGPGNLVDRSGGKLSRLLRDFRDDVMPLADECYEQALERTPGLAGGLDLQFEIIGDQDVGGLIETVTLLESSEIHDAEMVECMRETLLSTIFPAPDDSGSTGVELTLRFSPDE